MIFTDLSDGLHIRYERTKRDAQRRRGEWNRRYPLRQLLAIDAVEIPGVRSTDKTSFIDWLNDERRAK